MAQQQLVFDDSMQWPTTNILISLWPQYAHQLTTDDKKYEYRRGIFITQPATAFVYATTAKTQADRKLPSSQLVAVAVLGEPISGTEAVIRLKETEQPGSQQMMLDWLHGFTTASAHPIERVHILERPLALEDIRKEFPSFQPPQRYLMLNRNLPLLEFLKAQSGAFS